MEGENPTRRYKWFRPRQAAYGFGVISSPTNFGTIWLFNDSPGQFYLAVRDWHTQNVGASRISVYNAQGAQGTKAREGVSYMQSTGKVPGAIYTQDVTSNVQNAYLFDNNAFSGSWYHDFPLGVVEPGWSLGFQNQTQAGFMGCSLIWEWLSADQLDFLDW